eukprot:m.71025 g.71025  ORF g.71025 m.71025 type:complete len:138 (-) comp12194_c0_seq1:676-1089(-)
MTILNMLRFEAPLSLYTRWRKASTRAMTSCAHNYRYHLKGRVHLPVVAQGMTRFKNDMSGSNSEVVDCLTIPGLQLINNFVDETEAEAILKDVDVALERLGKHSQVSSRIIAALTSKEMSECVIYCFNVYIMTFNTD